MAHAVIYDPENVTVIADYKSEPAAQRALDNAMELGWKIKGRKYQRDWLQRMDVTTSETFRNVIDHDVEVINMMSGNPVTIKASQRGGVTDPSTERYWSM